MKNYKNYSIKLIYFIIYNLLDLNVMYLFYQKMIFIRLKLKNLKNY